MSQPTLWDYAQQQEQQPGVTEEAEDLAEQEDRERSRRQTFKRLRASGHWLTLLRVARSIAQPFTLNDISVAVWKACPEFFGMRGYPYPDNHKVHYILYGTRGLIAKGIIQRVRQGLFRIPDEVDLDALSQLPGEEDAESSSNLREDGPLL
jgi:hypothetical protein